MNYFGQSWSKWKRESCPVTDPRAILPKTAKKNIFLEESLEKVTFVAWKRQPTDTDLVVVDTCGHRVETEWLCTGTQQVAGAGIGTIIVVIVRGNLT